MAAPPGFVPEGFEPEAAMPAAAPSPVAPPSPLLAKSTVARPAGEDAVGAGKARLLQHPLIAQAMDPGPNRINRAITWPARFAFSSLPGSWEQGATAMALTAPGTGALPALARIGAAGTAGAGIAALKGKDPLAGGIEQGVSAATGEATGAVTRFAARQIGSAFNWTTDKLGDWIADHVPAFKGDSARATIRNVFSGEGQAALGTQYKGALDKLIQKSGDPIVNVPALTELGRSGPNRQMPAFFRASEAQTSIASLKRSLSGASGLLTRRKGGLEEISFLNEAEEQLHQQLAEKAPQEFAAFQEQARDYFRGKAIQRLFGYGRDVPTLAMASKLREPHTGAINEPMLERLFEARRGELQRAFSPKEFSELEQIITRGAEPGTFSTAGKPMRWHWFMGAVPHPTRFPKTPVRIGAPEQTADLLARAMRVLGGLKSGQLLQGSQ